MIMPYWGKGGGGVTVSTDAFCEGQECCHLAAPMLAPQIGD